MSDQDERFIDDPGLGLLPVIETPSNGCDRNHVFGKMAVDDARFESDRATNPAQAGMEVVRCCRSARKIEAGRRQAAIEPRIAWPNIGRDRLTATGTAAPA